MKLHNRLGTLSLVALAGCGAAVETVDLSAGRHTPVIAERIAPPTGAMAIAAWSAPEGGGIVALSDGNYLLVDRDGNATPMPRVSGDTVPDDERMVNALADRGGAAVAILAHGAMLLADGGALRAELPDFLAAPSAYASWRGEALWGAADGLYTSDGPRWWRLDTAQGALTGTTQMAGFQFQSGVDDAWILASGAVRRVRFAGGTTPTVSWLDAAPGIDLGTVSAIAAMSADHGAIASDRGLTVVSSNFIRQFRFPQGMSANATPDAVAGGGGWAWVAWNNTLFRTDGDRWDALVTDTALGRGTHIAVNHDTGTAALVTDTNGQIIRVVADNTLWLDGLGDGDVVIDPAAALEAVPGSSDHLQSVVFELDGQMLSTRMMAPWGWGTDGAAPLAVATLSFGQHNVRVTAHYQGSPDLTRTLHFTYTSPLGRIPVYADLAPSFSAHCSRCHDHGSVASDLSTYDLLHARGPVLRAAVREHRMPPDVLLDAPTIALFTSWIDGGARQ